MTKNMLEKYGYKVKFDKKELYEFWQPEKIAKVFEKALRELKVGYRAKLFVKLSKTNKIISMYVFSFPSKLSIGDFNSSLSFLAVIPNEYLGFEYITTNWAFNPANEQIPQFAEDTDTCCFPDRLMVLGIKKKYFEIKGFDTSAFQRDYDMQLNIAKANDQGSPTLSLAPRTANVLIGWENIPDANYGA